MSPLAAVLSRGKPNKLVPSAIMAHNYAPCSGCGQKIAKSALRMHQAACLAKQQAKSKPELKQPTLFGFLQSAQERHKKKFAPVVMNSSSSSPEWPTGDAAGCVR
ncbi:hypothetical protein AMAG_09973 [Allomyces macrogynus ATCC 38327]|uniref:Uncharacterized protein n=1 Tax=Allomyces macrogynus (strain ATCC 38327) TaxID=578462 RepID=A0A0L0SPZ9_ALLM3|nr:hypothetical protein AMAG_09973 [Allomyces macrogynus ATCC 38327]|eukprot:KNE64618.1 hypothetical protein AMAG_09973 [Allomyces macrogynus ATCC 38327]